MRPESRSRRSSLHSVAIGRTLNSNVHPSFQFKTVVRLRCRSCQAQLCARGMKAILLADTRVELYSTDVPPTNAVQLIGEDTLTPTCSCRTREIACLTCGNPVGYHVTQPCITCLEGCNNGHFWMFNAEAVEESPRLDPSVGMPMIWGTLPAVDPELDVRLEGLCR